jgi:hypothetical protein
VIRNWLSAIYYWLLYRFHPGHRYHVLKLGIKPGYSDVDYRIVHANFALLVQYVEQEAPFEIIDWDSCDEHKQAALEIRYLYNWYKNVRPHRRPPLADVPRPERRMERVPEDTCRWVSCGTEAEEAAWLEYCLAYGKWEQECYDEDTTNIKRLADIRHHLWT